MVFSRRDPRLNRGRIATAGGGDSGVGPNFAALGAAFWIDASRPNSYVASGTSITSIKSLVSGTALSTVTGTPTVDVDPRYGDMGFNFPGASYVKGADATYIAAVTGTDRPFCSIFVYEARNPISGGCVASVKNSASIGNGQGPIQSSSNYYWERDGAPAGPARVPFSEFVQAGLVVVVQVSDGLTVRTSVNGSAETAAAAMVTVGALSPNIVSVGSYTGSTDTFVAIGALKEYVYFGADKTFAEYLPWVTDLMAKWPGTTSPCFYPLGDSITVAGAGGVTNGGMQTLLSQRMRSLGLIADPIGPFSTGMSFPYAHSGVSGNTCAQMNTRVLSATQGLGLGGASKGHYRRARLTCLFAGTNDAAIDPTAANYATLLDNVYAQMLQAQPDFRIAVTTITDINGSTATVNTYNAALAGIWAAFEVAHPGVLIYWDAFQACPWNGTDFYDSAHPSNSGYVKLVDNPTYGLLQAVLPYLTSIQ